MVTLDNGAIVKSIHGPLKLETGSHRLQGLRDEGISWHIREQCPPVQGGSHQTCQGENTYYEPEKFVSPDLAKNSGMASHGGSDFYPTHFFIEKILGRPDGKWAIDVYQAVDMGICGILAFRSILTGNKPMKVPDLRDPAQRDEWRHDNACTNAAVAGESGPALLILPGETGSGGGSGSEPREVA